MQRSPKTIASLRLDLEAAKAGHTWLLLPEGFRDQSDGSKYPLPSRHQDIFKLACIYIPPLKNDAGCIYLKLPRARESRRALLPDAPWRRVA